MCINTHTYIWLSALCFSAFFVFHLTNLGKNVTFSLNFSPCINTVTLPTSCFKDWTVPREVSVKMCLYEVWKRSFWNWWHRSLIKAPSSQGFVIRCVAVWGLETSKSGQGGSRLWMRWMARSFLWWMIQLHLENYWFCLGPNRRWWWHWGESITGWEAASGTQKANICPLP